MQWFQCRSCRRSTPLSRASGWVQQWSEGHVSHFCTRCREAPTDPSSSRPAVRREYFVDHYGLVRTRPVRDDSAPEVRRAAAS